MEDANEVEVEDQVGVEAPKTRPPKTEAQLENVKKARVKKAENDQARIDEKERLKAEARFDRLLELFDQVRLGDPQRPPVEEVPVTKVRPAVEVTPTKVRRAVEVIPDKVQKKEIFLCFK